MNVLVAFATKHGQTQRIAEHIASRIRQQGHDVELCDIASGIAQIDVTAFDAIVVAAAVYRVEHHNAISDFVIAHREQLSFKPAALVSVSLSVVLPGGRQDADTYANAFMANTQGHPHWTLLIGGALRLAERDDMNPEVAERIIAEQRATTGTVQDFDFTDWELLSRFIDDFLAMASETALVPNTPKSA